MMMDMPDKIWAGYDSRDNRIWGRNPDNLNFTRTDIAQSLADALERFLLEFDFMVESKIVTDTRNDIIFDKARAALKEYRDMERDLSIDYIKEDLLAANKAIVELSELLKRVWDEVELPDSLKALIRVIEFKHESAIEKARGG